MNNRSAERDILRFKIELLGKLPFYGDILMNIVITEDSSVETSCTNGRIILYNPDYMNRHSTDEQNFILMHEVMHILLLHCARGLLKEPVLFNAAADIVVNTQLAKLESDMHRAGIPFNRPMDGIYAQISDDETVENLYEKLRLDNPDMNNTGGGRSRSSDGVNDTESQNVFRDEENDEKSRSMPRDEENDEKSRSMPRGEEKKVKRQGGSGSRYSEEGWEMKKEDFGSLSKGKHGINGPEKESPDGKDAPVQKNGTGFGRLLKRLLGRKEGTRAAKELSGSGRHKAEETKEVLLRRSYKSGLRQYTAEVRKDLLPGVSAKELEEEVEALLSHASGIKERSSFGSYYIPMELYRLNTGKPLNWKRLLQNLLTEEEDKDELSYLTPDRRFLHMDMIVPGMGGKEEKPGIVWAFVDSSGSVSPEEMDAFLTQMLALVKRHGFRANIAFWDIEVSEVFRNISNEKELRNVIPRHSGGTDINCVYDWIREKRIKPEVLLILTDGYFGELKPEYPLPGFRRKTILVLSRDGAGQDPLKRIGRIARLK